jgi:tetratricopeptide (TPR) repeat protein
MARRESATAALTLFFAWISAGFLIGQETRQKEPAPKGAPDKTDTKATSQPAQGGDPSTLPITKLAPAKLIPNLCVVKYAVTTRSPECQAFFDQGLGYFYSYVWMEAARSFETAAKHDPDCAMAWWGLSRAIEKWQRGQHTVALKKAQELLAKAGHREQLLINARLKEKGMAAGIAPDARKKEAVKAIDELLTLFDDDEEGWFYRAQLAEGPNAAVPFYKALLRINPLHPGANHELVHHYENIRRPALGWPHAVNYLKSSPGIAHAFHMQAHLGMRIGKWDKTTDWSARAIELERAYHKDQNVKPSDDFQFSHHLETLMLALTHDGRFLEANKLKKLCEGYKFQHNMLWYRLHLAERDYDAALKMAEHFAKSDKLTGAYLRALVYLKKGEPERAAPEVNVLREAYQTRRTDRELEARLWETQGILLCMQGGGDGGLKLLAKIVDRTKDDFRHHSWGHGAYYMEAWGAAALKAGRLDVAEEAFLEALAHDWGCARGALGMQVICERQGRAEEALRFAELAARCWRRADAGSLQIELADLRDDHVGQPASLP